MNQITDNAWLDDYFKRYTSASFEPSIYPLLTEFRDLVLDVRARGNKLIFAGNGASASIASHARVDFTKQGKCRSIDFNEPNLITAFANDFGFEHFMAKATEMFADDGDVLVLISVSGTSPNAVKAAEYARERGLKVVSFTGKSADNPLRQLSDIGFWLDSAAYNVVECTHMLWICTVVDMVVGAAEYSVN
ncbi:D-sedoheptulose-7-phosphate isomerase [Phaeobacter gallaeciensis]|uniref:D-sedoheptulose-7-phosphate isomerase n=1 Tax=Phaeobacter gallaeciensis TaxID=60890 RepID=UPI00237FC66B|nr:SIS domain-containing protein [Phaeobacter gallaeciensis]MDE4193117.1 SIS domain-containing protein [Phaeobacter gallaeciensis]MDE4201442.1 SIS domain-containing protein [Phaeobacter gallaeciensis]MDE4205622.1 SIS domain-containing protein [Phaeobacter gallaeciensis]MDE4209799.1 SIS domain-containing protein [Phaeobacter gallaeciensis]MDE4218162.1 SIS domain-containing protein [Phaeobacter gallaeciensis]